MNGRLLGVDYGTVRVGLAVSDPDRIWPRRWRPTPAATRRRRGLFRRGRRGREAVGLVVGLPMHTDGREGVKAEEAREFGAWLADAAAGGYVDERFTTVRPSRPSGTPG